MKASARTLRITPKKLNLIADLVRNKDALEAMEILQFAPKKGAKLLNKVVASAVANATNNFKQDEKSLYIKEIVVSKAPVYKRWLPASRGRVQPILKRNAHVTVTVAVKETTAPKPKKKAATKKASTTKAAPAKKSTPKPAAQADAPKEAKNQQEANQSSAKA